MKTLIALVVVSISSLVVAMTFTAENVIALITAIGILVGIAGGVAVQIIIAARAKKEVLAKADEGIAKTVEGIAKTEVVLGHVNSATSVLTTSNEALRSENAMLRAEMADRALIAAALAQSTATAATVAAAVVPSTPVTVTASNGPPPATESTLGKVADAVTKDPGA